ncbi:MAG TPA: ABC transporter substrate-binding protein [Stellaceae bacterium]|nr:ABC transporter substrate-binding protein [Stellaceae bacterium]
MRDWFKTLAGIALVLGFLAPAAVAQAPGGAAAGQFISGLGSQVIHLIADKQQPDAQRKAQFASLVRNSFDVDGIARFILGSYWRTASEQQRNDFTQTFATYMIDVYWSDFNRYSGQQLKVTGQRSESGNSTVVSTEIDQTNGAPPVNVDWRVIAANGGYKINDVSIAGVSELITYRDEFSNVIAQAGGNVDALTARLKQKIQQIGGS